MLHKTNICFDLIGKRYHLIEKGVELLLSISIQHMCTIRSFIFQGHFNKPKNLALDIDSKNKTNFCFIMTDRVLYRISRKMGF